MKAVIFDMDGVISDTQPVHAAIESEQMKTFGIDISPEEISARFSGAADDDFWTTVFREHNVQADYSNAIKDKWQLMLVKGKGNIKPIPGIQKVLKKLSDMNIPLAVASASEPEFIDLVLTELNIKEHFTAVVSTRQVKHGKPAPDIFLLAAKLINTKPEECIVIEDGLRGMQAAQKANMHGIGLVPDTKKEYPVKLKVTHLEDIPFEELLK